MKDLLKSFNLSDVAIKIYVEGLGKFPYTFSEIQSIIPDLSENEVHKIIDELIEKKLISLVNPEYADSLPHYLILPPFAPMLNNITELGKIPEDGDIGESKRNHQLERFREALYQDLENISGDLIDVISTQDSSNQTTEMLSEVEVNVKKFAQVILDDVIGLITQLKMQSAVDARDFNKLIKAVKEKISESEELTSKMFSQFRAIVKEMDTTDKSTQVEAFKTFIRRLGESIDKRVQGLSLGEGSLSLEKIQSLEHSLFNILTDYLSTNNISLETIWYVNSYEKIKEIISVLLDKSTQELTILVPNIEDFIPLEKFDLDYSEDQSAMHRKTTLKKPTPTGPSITKKQRKQIEEKFDQTAKKVAELKGFELSHDVADVLASISDINPESLVIESIQGWLNRLLVIRKHLDSNTQYLLLEAIEKWKKEYFKVKKKEKEPEKESIGEQKEKKSEEKTPRAGLKVQIISSESHDNKHALAFANKENTEYLQLEKNNVISILGDDSFLIFGVYQKTSNKPPFEISGFFTTYTPLIEIIKPLIVELTDTAKYPKEIEINRGFNEVIENINDYSGRKISKRLKRLLDVAFEKDGISLDILELKLLIGKLEKLYHPLEDDMKEYVINELNKLNKKFSTLELVYPPEFRPPILEEEVKGEPEVEIIPPEIEPLDPDKLDNLFELFLEKIEELKGMEISEQIDKFIGVVLKLKGYSNIIDLKNNLIGIDQPLEEPVKEKIKKALLSWKMGILQQTSLINTPLREESPESILDSQQSLSTQETPASIFKEEYVSPGLTQSQFGTEEEPVSVEGVSKVDPEEEMNELFKSIQTGLGEKSGVDLSKMLQNIVDIILETKGYSMTLKSLKDWISRLRKIREPLEREIKDDFELEFLKWKQEYCGEHDKFA